MRFKKIGVTLAASTLVATAVIVAGGSAAFASGANAKSSKSGITVLYTNNYVFDSDALAAAWWKSIAGQWKAADPSTPLTLLGTGGTDVDEMNKAAILFRSAAQTPCVIQLPTTYVGQFAGSGYLAPLNSYLSGSSAPAFWTGMPKGVQAMSTIGGKVYAVNVGNNDSGLVYNKVMLAKAGVPMPWVPKTWADVIAVAKKVHKAEPKVYALWIGAGVGAGPTNILQGIGNLIYGSTNPTMYDTKTGKWVVDSPGLTAALKFYQTVFKDGLGAPTSELFPADSVGNPPQLLQEGKLAISLGSNWYTGDWLKGSGAPWPAASKDVGIAPIPTENGQAPGSATTLGGWAFAVTNACPNKAAAWKFITLAESPSNQLSTAIGAGFVPPDTSVGKLPAFVQSSLYQLQFSQYAAEGISLPNSTNFPVYARALNTVTGDFAQNPNSETVAAALSTISSLVSQQLGASSVEKVK
jgi:multiple sugar transport system substrate-binding protein